MLIGFSFMGFNLMSQSPPPPPTDGHGNDSDPAGGGAPLNNGLGILLFMGSI